MKINEMVQQAHEIAKSKGWHDEERSFAEAVVLIHCELSEAIEADRKGEAWEENRAEELADVVIRIGDLCGKLQIDLEKAIIEKMEYNKTRPYKHGKKY
jgi:NTP pyrophosphatase (non-canonical NTP hydrolase)